MANNQTTEKGCKQKQDCERNRRKKIKENPELSEKAKIEQRQHYQRRKKEEKIKSTLQYSVEMLEP